MSYTTDRGCSFRVSDPKYIFIKVNKLMDKHVSIPQLTLHTTVSPKQDQPENRVVSYFYF